MKYTDRFFEFPVRIYDRFSTIRAEEMEKDTEVPNEGEWAAGMAKINYKQITTWSDYFDSTQGVEGVKDRGFEYTLVWTESEGAFICTWGRKKFEDKLNAYVEKFESWRSGEVEVMIQKLKEMGAIDGQEQL